MGQTFLIEIQELNAHARDLAALIAVGLVAYIDDPTGYGNPAASFGQLDFEPHDGVDGQVVVRREKHPTLRQIVAVRNDESFEAWKCDAEYALNSRRLSSLASNHPWSLRRVLQSGSSMSFGARRDTLNRKVTSEPWDPADRSIN